ncbi:hypothetical protein H1235_08575 [Pseudoxanthomonas sp. NC8]|nr:hypothetical protein H1235_08575 [Pseudoxanthomonas sp. NC8]
MDERIAETIALLVPVLGRALLHFLWQGVLIGLLAALALQLLRNARPQARYAVACLALLACVLAPTAWVAWELLSAGAGDAFAAVAPGPAGVPSSLIRVMPLPPAAGFAPRLDLALPWIVAAWAAGACTLSLRLAAGVWWIARLPAVPLPHLQRRWQQRLDALAARCGLRPGIALRLGRCTRHPRGSGLVAPGRAAAGRVAVAASGRIHRGAAGP